MADDTDKGTENDPEWFVEGNRSSLSGLADSEEDIRYGPRYNLQYIPKRLEKSIRPYLKATFAELLSYFRLYVSTIGKTQMVCIMEQDINWFFWYRELNAVFKSISLVFIQIFLAAYKPDEHFYLNKINPMMLGYNFMVIVAAFFELLLITNSNIFLLDYLIQGVTERAPWNRCNSPYIEVNIHKKKFKAICYTLEDFGSKIKAGNVNNQTLYFFDRVYLYKNEMNSTEYFQMAQILHYRMRIEQMKQSFQGSVFGYYFILIWITAALHNNQLFKKMIWKILTLSHYIEIGVYLLTYCYMYLFDDVMYQYDASTITQINPVSKEKPILIDIDFVSLSLNAPPVAHILFSRYKTDPSKIHYNIYSIIMVASNCIYGFLIGFTNQLILRYCEFTLGTKIAYAYQNINIFYYFYPIFFSRFYFGNIYMSVLLLFKFLSDYYLFVITFQCLVECVMWEWKYATKVVMTAATVLMAMLCYMLVRYNVMVAIYMYSKSAVNLVEIYTISLIYPMGRLIEDMTFHSGTRPNRVRIWNLRFLPVYMTIKVITIVTQMQKMAFFNKMHATCLIPIALLGLGVIYGIINTLFVEKRGCTALFCPEPEWGPADDVLRYCRKIYKMDEYIGSQVDRNLSRYMIGKAETESYRLDIRYDRRRSSAPAVMRYEDEKKYV